MTNLNYRLVKILCILFKMWSNISLQIDGGNFQVQFKSNILGHQPLHTCKLNVLVTNNMASMICRAYTTHI